MKRYLYPRLNVGAFALCMAAASLAQAPSASKICSPLSEGYFSRAKEMVASGNPLGALDQLRLVEENILQPGELEEYRFLCACASFQLDEPGCVALLKGFRQDFPASPLALEAGLLEGDYYFFRKQYGDAAQAYASLDLKALSGNEKSTYNYRYALSLLKCGETSVPKRLFSSLKGDKEYAQGAEFYLAYIDYVNGDLNSAYSRFEKVAGELPERLPQFSAHRKTDYVPTGLEAGYYMAQIEFKRGKFEDVIKRGKALMDRQPVAEMLPEIHRLVGESYYNLGEYESARPYLQDYVDETGDSAADTAVYDLGVICYDDAEYEEAEQLFSRLTPLRDSIGQSAWLYTGQILVKQGMDSQAALAFRQAYQTDFDSNVTETALYNYVAATTRGGNIPFASSIDMLEEFLKRFPASEHASTAREYLAQVYYNEKNYEKALNSINSIPDPSASVLEAKQKVLYELGMECMSNAKYSQAERHLQEAVALSKHDKGLALQSRLWLGDALYAQGKYADADKEYSSFISSAPKSANRTLAIYDYAYSLYMQGKYKNATSKFADALSSSPALPKTLADDARIRLADCRYYTGDYNGAANDYDRAIRDNASEADYAAYRHAIMLGLNGNISRKITELDNLASRYPGSKWIPAAMLEKTLTYQGLDQDDKAVSAANDLTAAFPNSAEARKGMLAKGISLNKAGKAGEGAVALKEVIARWPSSEEALLANEDLRKYYASIGQLKEYAAFLQSVPGAPQLNRSELERLEYEAAALKYGNEDDASALETYVKNYPNGEYYAQAMLDLSEHYTERGKNPQALAALDDILLKKGDSSIASEALYRKGKLMEELDGNPDEILKTYRELLETGGTQYALDAYAGIMRTTPTPGEMIKYARLIQQSGSTTPELNEEALFFEATGLDRLNDRAQAMTIYSQLAQNPKSYYGARSAVQLGQAYLDNKEYKKAEQVLTKFTDAGTPHQYWLARGYIALADAYKGLGKKSLALEYLNSLQSNYPGDEADIQKMINTRINSWK